MEKLRVYIKVQDGTNWTIYEGYDWEEAERMKDEAKDDYPTFCVPADWSYNREK